MPNDLAPAVTGAIAKLIGKKQNGSQPVICKTGDNHTLFLKIDFTLNTKAQKWHATITLDRPHNKAFILERSEKFLGEINQACVAKYGRANVTKTDQHVLVTIPKQ